MKIRAKIALLAVLTVAASVMAVTAVKSVAAGDVKDTADLPMINASVDVKSDSAEYYLRDCSGYIAVFKGDSSAVPIEITEIETETLNENDRQLLMEGIPAENRTELLTLLEDLGS